MNIVLIGYRGTGKSVVGRMLARRLERELFSIDALVVKKAGMPIKDIVTQDGWPRFREMESETIAEVCGQTQNGVIDCGGGAVLDPKNIEVLKANGKAVLLTADFDVLLKRLKPDKARPPLKDGMSFEEEQKNVMAERKKLYEQAADFVCDTSKVGPDVTVGNIIKHFLKQGWIE